MIETELNLQHLLKLLDDSSAEIQKIVRNTILENSLEILLKRPFYQMQADPELRPSLEEMLNELHFDLIKDAFGKLIETNLEDIDLEKAVMLLAYWNDPDVDVPSFVNRLDLYAGEIGNHMPVTGHPLAFIDHLNYYIFKKFGFKGNTSDYYNPDNSFINRVMETKKGIPITLSVIYMLISRRLELSIAGVPMPAHFIVKFDNGTDEIYIDPFYEGKIYSQQECREYLNQANNLNTASILEGCADYQIILRMMRNIELVYSSYQDEPQKKSEIEQLITLVEQNYQ